MRPAVIVYSVVVVVSQPIAHHNKYDMVQSKYCLECVLIIMFELMVLVFYLLTQLMDFGASFHLCYL
jgi:hypothetical protein